MRRALALVAVGALAGAPLLPTAIARAEDPSAVAPGTVPEPAGLYLGAMHGYTPNTVKGGSVIDTAALATLVQGHKAVLLDVAEKDRKPPGMGAGMIWAPTHRTIPGAVFLQGGGKGTGDGGYGAAFKARVAELTGGDLDKPVVTFCHPDCWGSYNAARRLADLGYRHVFWYRDGVEGWQANDETRSIKPDERWVASLPSDLTQ